MTWLELQSHTTTTIQIQSHTHCFIACRFRSTQCYIAPRQSCCELCERSIQRGVVYFGYVEMMCCLDPLHLLLQQSEPLPNRFLCMPSKIMSILLLSYSSLVFQSWAMGCFTFLFAILCVVGLCRATLYQGLIGSPTRKARRCWQSWTASLSRGGCTRHGFEKQRRISEQKIHYRSL